MVLSKRFLNLGSFSPSQIIAGSFFLVILIGTLLLMLPQAARGESLSFVDALFMATSALCVTGLIVVDTGTDLTLFGQVVILILIQMGGLGIMALSSFVILMLKGSISLQNRKIIQETLSDLPVKGLGRLLRAVMILTFSIELIGAVLLFIRMQSLGVENALFSSVFHSVSAFCNAGFSLNTTSFEAYRGELGINLVLMILIILGGLGFLVLNEITERFLRKEKRRMNLHARVVLFMTAVLIFGGALLYAFLERNRFWTVGDPTSTWILESLFQSVTARTAGFNTITMTALANPTLFLLMLLMFVGAAPGSTAGGIKVTTVVVLGALLRARIRGEEEEVSLMGRALPSRLVSKAVAIVVCMSLLVTFSFGALLITEQEFSLSPSRENFVPLLFESISAMGTVGLSMGSTAHLSAAGKLIVTLTMFLGRLGPLTLALAVAQGTRRKILYQYPEENVMVG